MSCQKTRRGRIVNKPRHLQDLKKNSFHREIYFSGGRKEKKGGRKEKRGGRKEERGGRKEKTTPCPPPQRGGFGGGELNRWVVLGGREL